MNKDPIFLQISRVNVWNLNLKPALTALKNLKLDPVRFNNRLHLVFTGYDNDPRELYQIPEVIKYYRKLDKLAPYLPVFLHRQTINGHNQLFLYFAIITAAQVVRSEGGQTLASITFPEGLLKDKLVYIGQFLESAGVGQQDADVIFKGISDALDNIYGKNS